MSGPKTIYILGAGAIGLSLGAFLAAEGRRVILVRTSKNDVTATKMPVTVRDGHQSVLTVRVEAVSLAKLNALAGIVVIATKSHANHSIASALKTKMIEGPLVILQNGIGVEQPFLDSLPGPVYRCVLYATSQLLAENEVAFRPIASSPIGIINGTESELEAGVTALTTQHFRFHSESNLPAEIWKKAIINSVFNSICPLLETDNGIFVRSQAAADLAAKLVHECIPLAERKGITLTEAKLMDQIMKISQGSSGALISTLQDMRKGRKTEIEFLNLEMARIASSLEPKMNLGKTEFLGQMILAKGMAGRA